MAADVRPPRMVRETTNMEDAAAAMRARASGAAFVEPNLIDFALGDLDATRNFLDATDRYFDELNEWLGPNGCTPNRALHTEVCRGQFFLREAVDQVALSEIRLREALRQAQDAKPERKALGVAPVSAFAEAFEIYRDAWNVGVATYLLNFPGLIEQDRCSSVYDAFESLTDPLYRGAREAAVNALLAPANSAEDLLLKQEIIDQQEIHNGSDSKLIGLILARLIADGAALAGDAQ